jgi:hypothetical protein
MPIPINDLKLSDINDELGINYSSIEDMFLSEFVVESGLDPIYCSSLVSLRTKPYEIGKWRNYGVPPTSLPPNTSFYHFSNVNIPGPIYFRFVIDPYRMLSIHYNAFQSSNISSGSLYLIGDGEIRDQRLNIINNGSRALNTFDSIPKDYMLSFVNENVSALEYIVLFKKAPPWYYYVWNGSQYIIDYDNPVYSRIILEMFNTGNSLYNTIYNSDKALSVFYNIGTSNCILNVTGGGQNDTRVLSFGVYYNGSLLMLTDTSNNQTSYETQHYTNKNANYAFTIPSTGGTTFIVRFKTEYISNPTPISYSFKVIQV